MSIRVPCSACHGHGEVELPAPYRATLGRADGEWRTTSDVLHRHGSILSAPARTALINRLNALVRWGLVERRGTGRSVEWRRT
jgi:hypothetical protein